MASEDKRTTAARLARYHASRRAFSWDAVRRELEGLPGGGLNIGHEAVDRHAAGPAAGRVALRFVGEGAGPDRLTFEQLRDLTGRFANALASLGVGTGERVFTLLGRSPELYVAALGALKRRCVFGALFASYGPEPVRDRLAMGGARVLVTTRRLFATRVAPRLRELPELAHVLLIDGIPDVSETSASLHDLGELVDAQSAEHAVARTSPDDLAFLHFTSGTTGLPKGALHAHEAVVACLHTARAALDLRPDDVYWCTADPGWITGVSYGIVAPLVVGCTSVVDRQELDPWRWYATLEAERVGVCYTSPTALRMARRIGEGLARSHDLSALRLLACVGEPLEAGLVEWTRSALGLPVRDTWWQTETGSIVIASLPTTPLVPGSMGLALPGAEVRVVHGEEGRVRDVERPGETGELAIRRDWPSLFRGYDGDPTRYAACFAGDWYLTGDLVRRDAEGYFRFVGRADDVIKSAGHLVGPVEVERTLLEHPAVAEAAVVGRPDPVAGEIVRAYVVPAPGHEQGDGVRRAILAHARSRLGPALAPKELELVESLPRTHSGKILRRALREDDRAGSWAPLETEEPTR